MPLLPTYRQLRDGIGDDSKAVHVWFILWQVLFYRLQDGAPSGVIPACERGLIENAFEPISADPAERRRFFDALISSRLLKLEGEDYVCLRFQVAHGSAEKTPQSIARSGGNAKAFVSKQRHIEGAAMQQSLMISGEKFVDENGQPLNADETRAVTRLIISCDNALFKGERMPMAYTEGLILEALKVVRKFSEDQIDYILRTVAKRREHPVLRGLQTEKLLPIFGDIVVKLGGN